MKYKEVVNKENSHKVFLCKLTDGRTIELQVHDTCEYPNKEVFAFYNFEDDEDVKEYPEEDVEEVYSDDFLSAWSKLTASVQDIQLEVAEQDYLNGELD